MSRKKGEALAERAANLAIRYAELEQQMLDVMRERDGYKGDLHSLEKHYEESMRNAASLRAQLDDMRKVRDRAVDNAEGAEMRLHDKQLELARCLGWIDAKMDKSPQIDDFGRIPF